MSFRRKHNSSLLWKSLVEENKALLAALPSGALVNEQAFRGYLTSGVYRDVKFRPSIFELSSSALDDLVFFVHHKAQFDLDTILFEDFNQALCSRTHKLRA